MHIADREYCYQLCLNCFCIYSDNRTIGSEVYLARQHPEKHKENVKEKHEWADHRICQVTEQEVRRNGIIQLSMSMSLKSTF